MMMEVAVNFYKDLFRRETRPDVHLAVDFWKESE